LKARIGHTDDKINRMVYQLYGLTEEGEAIVENFLRATSLSFVENFR
jgi:hypothetical protein